MVQSNSATNPVTFDFMIEHLADRDRQVRKSVVFALGNMGDARAVEPLIFSLSRELARDAGSYPVIIEILDAMMKMPDRRALDALVKAESQMTDRDSPECPAALPAGVITYHDIRDGRMRRAVPRQLHFKVLDVMRRMSVLLRYREEEVSVRFDEYQQEIIRAEIDRMMPDMAELLKGNDKQVAQMPGAGAANGRRNMNRGPIESDPLPDEVTAGVDYDVLRRKMEQEVSEYLADNEKLLGLIREGQRIKAHIRQERAEQTAVETGISRSGKVNAR